MVLESGAVVSGGIAFAGSGTLEIVGSAMPSATISGFTSAISSISPRSLRAPAAAPFSPPATCWTWWKAARPMCCNLDPSQNYSGTHSC